MLYSNIRVHRTVRIGHDFAYFVFLSFRLDVLGHRGTVPFVWQTGSKEEEKKCERGE